MATDRRASGRALAGLLVLLAGAGCAHARLAPRYLSRCPAPGPEPASDLGIRPIPFDLDAFYTDVRERTATFEIDALGAVREGDRELPVLAIRRPGPPDARKLLVVAGIHGNETAGLLAVAPILDLLETGRPEIDAWDVTVIAPANPVGAVHASRYNGDGCDLNRDFGVPRTREARWIRETIEADPPDSIVSLHEGPQDGYLLVVTSAGSRPLAEAAVRAVDDREIALATEHFTGFGVGTPGLSFEGGGTDFAKWLLRLHTLGRLGTSLGIGTYTVETSWSSPDFDERVRAHVTTVEALLVAGAGPEADAGRGAR